MLHAFLLIVVGLAGDPEHGELFHKWGASLAESAAHLGVPADHLVYLVDEPAEGEAHVTGKATLEEINKTFDRFAKQATAEDAVYVVLIGHGSFDGKAAKFNLPGPDISAADFAAQFKRLPTRQIVFVDTASASGPFINELSAPGRTIITATRNGAENYATLFGGYFVDALSGDEADADKNGRVTMLEAFPFAKAAVRAGVRQGRAALDRARGARRQRRQGRQPRSVGDRRRRQDGRADGDRLGGRREAAAGRPEAARAGPRAARSRAPRRVAAAAEGQHGSGEIPE